MTFGSSFCKKGHCIHILWCIFMGLGHNDPWVESHMWPQQMWGQRSSRSQWPLVQILAKTVTVSIYFDVFSGETRGSRTTLFELLFWVLLWYWSSLQVSATLPWLIVQVYLLYIFTKILKVFAEIFEKNKLEYFLQEMSDFFQNCCVFWVIFFLQKMSDFFQNFCVFRVVFVTRNIKKGLADPTLYQIWEYVYPSAPHSCFAPGCFWNNLPEDNNIIFFSVVVDFEIMHKFLTSSILVWGTVLP